ncbi:MAG: type III-B CRISPR-associated protein Cas10/Cmr2 [Candidatus Bipolaricaulia bacterium]
MDLSQLLSQQRRLYTELPDNDTPQIATHPLSGEWQQAKYLKNEFWWGGGATQEACEQLKRDCCQNSQLTGVAALSFGPVQDFLGGGQRLRDWAVASWLCHYLSAVFIYRWEQQGGCMLLPLHLNSPLVNWLNGKQADTEFWQAELPNVFTGLFPETEGWLDKAQNLISEEWQRFVAALEQSAVEYHSKLLNGQGWQVIRQDHQYLWSVYAESASLQNNGNAGNLATVAASLHQQIEAQKLGRNWQKKWWGGRTSPTAGQLSTWHPGLLPVDKGGTWGLPDSALREWWERAAQESRLSGLFSDSDRLNSIELVKRLASVPDIIEPTLERLWGSRPPSCPWERFPDRTAVAAAWVPSLADSKVWNENLEPLSEIFYRSPYKQWGMPQVDEQTGYIHPRVLERRNIKEAAANEEDQELWEEEVPKGWESAIEWTVGWRGDGDQIGEWLSGRQYEQKNLPWQQWHPSQETIDQYHLNIEAPQVPKQPRQVELPHLLDLSVLFRYWNGLLYRLSEEQYNSKVIFAGGDDFLIIGPITDTVPLSSQLHKLWLGQASDLTKPLPNSEDGWSDYQGEVYPIPGQKMSFSLGVVIAQRRIPQSLWHRGLDEAYKKAKKQGRDRVCVKVLFNSGQTLEWVCPWPLWHLLMELEPNTEEKTDLNRWEKLLSYLESTRIEQENSPATVKDLLNTLWASVGLSLRWEQVEAIVGRNRDLRQVIGSWSWWRNWIAVRAFLTRQERDRAQLLEQLTG